MVMDVIGGTKPYTWADYKENLLDSRMNVCTASKTICTVLVENSNNWIKVEKQLLKSYSIYFSQSLTLLKKICTWQITIVYKYSQYKNQYINTAKHQSKVK